MCCKCCKTKCCKTFFKVLTIILALMDIAVGWYKFYELYRDTVKLDNEFDQASAGLQADCGNPQLYWKVYVPFEVLGTIFTFMEIYYIIREIKEDKCLFNQCFSRTFYLIVAIYIFSIFPATILDIIFMDKCVCHEGFSLNVVTQELRDFFKGFLSGASVVLFQVLVHMTEIFYRVRRTWRFVKSGIFCCKRTPDEDNMKKHEAPWKVQLCFVISLILFMCYLALFTADMVFIFCNKY